MYFVGTRGECVGTAIFSLTLTAREGSSHVAVSEKRPARRSRCSELSAYGRVSAVLLHSTSIKPPKVIVITLRLIHSLSSPIPFLEREETWMSYVFEISNVHKLKVCNFGQNSPEWL